jgi:hypothetical protein
MSIDDYWIDQRGRRITFEMWAKLRRSFGKHFKIRNTRIKPQAMRFRVSTVFLGMDPLLGCGDNVQAFETALFKDGEVIRIWRYATRQEACEGHREMVRQLRYSFTGNGSYYKYRKRK